MLGRRRLEEIADLIREQVSMDGLERYCRETGVSGDDFIKISPQEFNGRIFAVDGSNVLVCDWSAANLNRIRAGYAVYKGRAWQKTVITYDDVFLADRGRYEKDFEPYRERLGMKRLSLKGTELERLSTYFREIQEYTALSEAIREAAAGDIILYDGGFSGREDWPLWDALKGIFEAAEKRSVSLIGISKSSAISWGDGDSRPFVQHTAFAGSVFAPGEAWYLPLRGRKNIKLDPPRSGGEILVVRFDGRCPTAFRVDIPSYLYQEALIPLCRLAAHSCSAECLGYPHALFRAHRDIRITAQEGFFARLQLMNLLSEKGLSEAGVRSLIQDYHDVIEMRPRM